MDNQTLKRSICGEILKRELCLISESLLDAAGRDILEDIALFVEAGECSERTAHALKILEKLEAKLLSELDEEIREQALNDQVYGIAC